MEGIVLTNIPGGDEEFLKDFWVPFRMRRRIGTQIENTNEADIKKAVDSDSMAVLISIEDDSSEIEWPQSVSSNYRLKSGVVVPDFNLNQIGRVFTHMGRSEPVTHIALVCPRTRNPVAHRDLAKAVGEVIDQFMSPFRYTARIGDLSGDAPFYVLGAPNLDEIWDRRSDPRESSRLVTLLVIQSNDHLDIAMALLREIELKLRQIADSEDLKNDLIRDSIVFRLVPQVLSVMEMLGKTADDEVSAIEKREETKSKVAGMGAAVDYSFYLIDRSLETAGRASDVLGRLVNMTPTVAVAATTISNLIK